LWREEAVNGAVAGLERGSEGCGGAELRRGYCCQLRVEESEQNGASGEKRALAGA